MDTLASQIESLLFLEPKPLSFGQLAKACKAKQDEVEQAAATLQEQYAQRGGGVQLVVDDSRVQLTTADVNTEFVADYLKQDATAELTRPSLETLTIIAYRGPVPKSELELIRGVNCSLILRNLMIRGLIEQTGETEAGSPLFSVTTDFLRHVGVSSASELPEYEELNKNVHLEELLAANQDPDDFFNAPQ
jgi:segregation and condensation protein B